MSLLGISAFFCIENLFGVVVFQRSMVKCGGWLCLSWVYVHSSIYKTYLVKWHSRDLWSNVGGMSVQGICAFFYM